MKKKVKVLIDNFKRIKWAKPKQILAGVGNVIVITAIACGIFGVIDIIGSLIVKAIG